MEAAVNELMNLLTDYIDRLWTDDGEKESEDEEDNKNKMKKKRLRAYRLQAKRDGLSGKERRESLTDMLDVSACPSPSIVSDSN